MRKLNIDDIDFDEVVARIKRERQIIGKKRWVQAMASTGIKPSLFSNVLGKTNQKPSLEFIVLIALALKKPIEYFLLGKDSFMPLYGDKFVSVPFVSNYTKDDNSLIYLKEKSPCSCRYDWLANISEDPWKLVGMVMHGDVMEPLVMHSSIMLIDITRKKIMDGGIFAFNFTKLKYIQIRTLSFYLDKIKITPGNDSKYECGFVDVDKINIIGQVICAKNIFLSEETESRIPDSAIQSLIEEHNNIHNNNKQKEDL